MGGAPLSSDSGGPLVPRMMVPAAMDISGLLGPEGGARPSLGGAGVRTMHNFVRTVLYRLLKDVVASVEPGTAVR